MEGGELRVTPVGSKASMKEFIDLPYRLYADDPNWVPPLRDEVIGLVTPGKNPWFEHGEAQFFVARRADRVVGRISAHIDHIALTQPVEQGMGPGTGFWGLLEAEDQATVQSLITQAENWLRSKKMTHALGPVSLAMWDEPGLLIQGHDMPPTVMMGHNKATYEPWVESAGYAGVEDLYTYDLSIGGELPLLAQRIVAMGEKGGRIRIRKVDKSKFDAEAALILAILNDAWSDNWGFVPFTDAEIAYAGKKLKPIVYEDLIRIAEFDGEPVAFIMTLPDLNEKIRNFNGTLWPFNWAKLLWWLRKPKVRTMRVPLMGVVKKLQSSRVAIQLAMMLVEYTRRDAITKYGASRGEFGWVLASNGPMRSIGESVGGTVNKVYRIYRKQLT